MRFLKKYVRENPKTETAIVKSILLEQLKHRLKVITDLTRTEDTKTTDTFLRELFVEATVLREIIQTVTSLSDILYTVRRVNRKIIEIRELGGNLFELSLSREAIGGNIYQLKDTSSNQVVEIIAFDYLNNVEKSCINGYLCPEGILLQALEQLKKSC